MIDSVLRFYCDCDIWFRSPVLLYYSFIVLFRSSTWFRSSVLRFYCESLLGVIFYFLNSLSKYRYIRWCIRHHTYNMTCTVVVIWNIIWSVVSTSICLYSILYRYSMDTLQYYSLQYYCNLRDMYWLIDWLITKKYNIFIYSK